jgi:hypothetical protein
MSIPLTPNAKALLARLQSGTNTANAPANIGAFAYSVLARAFLSNAQGLCRDEGLSDFRVYGALYALRHGFELMLKCIVRNDLMDTTLRVLMTAGLSFDDVCRQLGANKKEKASLQHSLCVMRNVLEDRVTFPDCHTRKRGRRFCRTRPPIPQKEP